MPRRNQHFDTDFVQEHIHRALDDLRAHMLSMFDYMVIERSRAESPLEAAFEIWWHIMTLQRTYEYALEPQLDVVVGDERFRLDFIVERAGSILKDGAILKLAIELDGHEFHERTKEQVELRNRRDRLLTAAGWRLLHFSGSEFHRDPFRCVEETWRAAAMRARELGLDPFQSEP